MAGPSDSVYAGGLYHGVIRFPSDYPFAPPNLSFLTPSGRFQTGVKICLSITGYHPDQWQPAWGVRTMLIALRDHFGQEEKGSIGSLQASEEERRRLAVKSRSYQCRVCEYRGPCVGEGQATASSNFSGWAIFIAMAAIILLLSLFIKAF